MSKVLSYKCTSAIGARRVVAHAAAAYTCRLPASANVMPLGITIDDVDQSGGGTIPVQVNGLAKLEFGAAATSGALVTFDSAGLGLSFTPAVTSTGLTVGTGVVGVLVSDTISATGTIGDVQIMPQFIR